MFMHKTIPSLVGLLSQVSCNVYNVPIFAIFTNVKKSLFFFFAGGGGGIQFQDVSFLLEKKVFLSN